ncbi:glycosyltransferase family 2 protein [Lysobacter panacisoli]|uniref:Glycosyltransferase family 2 protein n=2 Tax=Lysobacter panacisoli TaxID=1255263 RepID=A0ABP9L3M3_9GAMM|nr:glycosyltransferase family 2 protein [Lysobacter panacisoli]
MPRMAALPISLIVITHNEASNIARCLDSVPFAAEKIVVDSGSTDGTQDIAQACGARVVQQEWLGFGPQRNFASTLSSHDWIVVLDADEFMTDALIAECARELPAIMASDNAAVWLRRETWYMGAPMRWYRPLRGEVKARIYHRDRAKWTNARVHESLEFDGKAASLSAPFSHRNNPTLVHKQLKVLRYSELKALDWFEHKRGVSMWSAPLVFVGSFIKDYVFRLGFMDGWRGFILSQVAASYAIYKRMRYYEMQRDPQTIDEARSQLVKHGLEH